MSTSGGVRGPGRKAGPIQFIFKVYISRAKQEVLVSRAVDTIPLMNVMAIIRCWAGNVHTAFAVFELKFECSLGGCYEARGL